MAAQPGFELRRSTDRSSFVWDDAARTLHRAALAVAQPGGPTLFADLVHELVQVLHVAVVFIAVYTDEANTEMRTLAVELDGKLLRNFDYRLQGTPCAQVVGRQFRYVPRGVSNEFPPGSMLAAKGMDSYAAYPLTDSDGAQIGLLVAMDRAPIADETLAEAVLKIFAGRIAAEIERGCSDEALRAAALAVSSARGASVFAELVRYLATILRCEVAFIARHEPDDPDSLRMLAMTFDGQMLEDIRYAVAGTPCATVLGQTFRVYPDRLQERFPDDLDAKQQGTVSYAGYPLSDLHGAPLGLVAIASRQPLSHVERIESMLQIFAVRAAAEIERLRADEALRRSEASYRAIFEAAEDAIFVHDWDTGRVVDVNRKACEVYGYTADELRAVSIDDISSGVPPYTGAEAIRWVLQAKNGHCPPFEWHRRNKDGSLHWDEVRLKAAEIGGQRRILAFTREITERKRAVEELRAREEQYRAIFEGSADAMVLWNADIRIVDVNRAFSLLYGYTREDVIGTTFGDRIPSEGAARRIALIRAALAGFEGQLETQALKKSGVRFDAELRYLPIVYRGEPHVLAVARDISARRSAEAERAELEAQLRQAQKMEAIGQLTGGIAHDFNNILTSVVGYGAMARERADATGDATLVRHLEQVQLAAQRARDLVAQMLTFSRGQRGQRSVIALAPLVRQTVRLLRATLPSSIELDSPGLAAHADDGAPTVDADPVQIEQVLFNLCINARDAIGGAGHIGVRLREVESANWHCSSCRARVDGRRWVELSVADDGCGIPPEVLERMFDPFYTTKEVGRGSGMGLAMVHGIVHDHGGHVRVESRPGAGAVFRVLLPPARRAGAAAAPALPSTVPTVAPALQGRVLLVEDEAMVGEFMAELLAAWGLDVVLERDPTRAAAWIDDAANEVDLVITDRTMPRMTGLQLALRIRAARPQLPVLLVTGDAAEFDAAELRRCGVDAALRKPILPEELRASLRRLLAGAGVA